MILRKLIGSATFRNFGILVGGNAIAQAINLLFSPVLSRIFDPEDFGWFYFFTSISSTIGTVAALKLELALVLPKEDSKASALFKLGIRLVFLSTLLSLLIIGGIYLFYEKIHFFSLLIIPFIALLVYLQGIQQLYLNWSVRIKSFRINSISRVTQAVIFSTLAFILGVIAAPDSWLLLLAFMAGYLGSVILLTFGLKKTLPEKAPDKAKELLKEFKDFPVFNTPHALLGVFQDLATAFIITLILGSEIFGAYAFAYRILKAPAGLIGAALFQVYLSKLSEMKNAGRKISPMIRKTTLFLSLISLPFALIMMLFGEELFVFIFSEKWQYAGLIGIILTPAILLNFLTSPLSAVPLVLGEQKKAFLFTVATIGLKVIALIITAITKNATLAFILLSLSDFIVMSTGIIWYFHIAGKADRKLV